MSISQEDAKFLQDCMLKGIDALKYEEKIKYLAIFDAYKKDAKIFFYKPNPKAIFFHKSAAPYRLLCGGNRSGKSYSGAAEILWMAMCIHPYKKTVPDEYWVVSETYQVQEEASQKIIMELLPSALIRKKNMRIANVIDNLVIDVLDPSGQKIGESKIAFKSSDSGVRKFAGAAKRAIWFDEEPPFDIYQECIARMGAGKDLDIFLTMTPIFEQRGIGRRTGMSWTYRELYQKSDNLRIASFKMSVEDNIYLSKEQIEEQKRKYEGAEYDIRIKGEFKLLSGNHVFDIDTIEHYHKNTVDPVFVGQIEQEGDRPKLREISSGLLKVFEYPKMGMRYFIGADIGLGVGGDPSCAVVMDKNMKIVAELHGQIPPDRMAYLIRLLGNYYKEAYVGVEANSFGISCIDNLKHKYGKLYFRYKVDQRSDIKTRQIGWWTDTKTKPLMIGEFGKALREQALVIPSKQLVDELTTYVIDSNGAANAEIGCHDDRVMASMIALQVRKKFLLQAHDVKREVYVPTNRMTGY